MEDLYKKLYNKYTNLKTEKYAEMEEMNREQESKFVNYVNVVEEMIEYLRSENDKLSREVSELRTEVSSISSTKDEQCIQYQKLLMEANQKNAKLLEEINKLRYDVECGLQGTPSNSTPGPTSKTKPGPSSNSVTVRMTRRRTRESNLCSENRTTHVAEEVTTSNPLSDTDNRSRKQTKVDETLLSSYLPPCCRRKTTDSGKDATETVPVSCKFQDLLECVVGMELSAIPENDASISVGHPSSGLCFSLTWVNTSKGEPEIEYNVLSFGTFEHIAPDWMKDVLRFSPRMCWVFFRKVKRDLKLDHLKHDDYDGRRNGC